MKRLLLTISFLLVITWISYGAVVLEEPIDDVTKVVKNTPTVTPTRVVTVTATPTEEPNIMIGVSGLKVKVTDNIHGRWVNPDVPEELLNICKRYNTMYSDDKDAYKADSCMILAQVPMSKLIVYKEEAIKLGFKIEIIKNIQIERAINLDVIESYKEENNISDIYEKYTEQRDSIISREAEVVK